MQRSSPRLRKATPKAAALKTPPRAKAPSPKATPSKRQPNSHAANATPNKQPRRGLQHFKLKRKYDKKQPRVARQLLEPELEPEPEPSPSPSPRTRRGPKVSHRAMNRRRRVTMRTTSARRQRMEMVATL